MNEQKVFFPINIKFLRERKKLSQDSLAENLEIGRSKLNALERGQTKAPQPEDLINFSEYFKISIDSLLKVDLSKLSELKLRQLEAGSDDFMTGSNLRILSISVDEKNNQNMEYVPIKAKAGYQAGCNDPEYIRDLPKFTMPNLPKGGTFRMFPTVGDSMLPIPEGSEVIGQYVEDWTSIPPGSPCILILKGTQDIVFKQVTIGIKGSVELRSFNTLYKPYTVQNGDILEIWKFYKYQTEMLPGKETDLEVVLRSVNDLKEEMKGKSYNLRF